MWTKGQIVDETYGELALAGYVFDLSPEDRQTALRRLDAMMATWAARGVQVGYAFPTNPDDADPSTPSGLPDSAIETVLLNLALRLAPANGKQISDETRRAAREGYQTLLTGAAMPAQQQLPGSLPRGAGNRRWISTYPFFPKPRTDHLPVEHGDMTVTPE